MVGSNKLGKRPYTSPERKRRDGTDHPGAGASGLCKRALVLLLLGLVGVGYAAAPLQRSPTLAGRELYRRTAPGIGWVLAAGQGKGTGFLVDRERRWLLTNYHVVGENATAEVLFPVFRDGQPIAERNYYLQNRDQLQQSGHLSSARVLHRDPDHDLALLQADRLPATAVALPLAASATAPGELVWALGNRYDSNALWVLARGHVRTCRTLKEGYFSAGKQLARGARVIEARVPINEGDSGGPLLNDRGEVVGVTAAVAWENQGSGLFLDVSEVLALLAKVRGETLPPLEPADVVRRGVYRRGVVSVVLVQRPGSSQRQSGLLLDRDRRLVVTTADAVGRKDTATLTFPAFRLGRSLALPGQVIAEAQHYQERKLALTGVVLARDLVRNLALIEAPRLPEGVEPVRLATDDPLPGDAVHNLGNPDRISTLFLYGAGWLRQRGQARLGPGSEDPEVPVLLLQLTPSEGEAGGPVLNDRAELVGVLAGKSAPQQQLAYALPLSELQAFLRENQGRWQPARARDWVERGRLFLKARQAERAIGDFSEALRIDPDNAQACSERSRAFQQQGDLERALADSNRAIQLQPGLSQGYSQRAAVCVQLGRLKEALADCEMAVRLDRSNSTAYRVRGEVHRLLGDLERALADCSEAIWLDRKSAPAYLERGRVRAARDERDGALADYNQALALDPELAEAYRCRGDLFWARSDVQAAWADYDQALTLRPADPTGMAGARTGLVCPQGCDASPGRLSPGAEAPARTGAGGDRRGREPGAGIAGWQAGRFTVLLSAVPWNSGVAGAAGPRKAGGGTVAPRRAEFAGRERPGGPGPASPRCSGAGPAAVVKARTP